MPTLVFVGERPKNRAAREALKNAVTEAVALLGDQTAVGKAIGSTQPRISAVVNGKGAFEIEALIGLRKLLKRSIDDILGLELIVDQRLLAAVREVMARQRSLSARDVSLGSAPTLPMVADSGGRHGSAVPLQEELRPDSFSIDEAKVDSEVVERKKADHHRGTAVANRKTLREQKKKKDDAAKAAAAAARESLARRTSRKPA